MLTPRTTRKSFSAPASTIPAPLLAKLRMEPGRPLEIRFRFNKGERKICRKKRRTLTSEWAAKNRRLDLKETSRPGKWKNEETPWLVGIMDALCFPSVREEYICKSPQFGGSEGINNFVGRCIDLDPGNVLLVYPDEKDVKKNIKRIQSMIKNSPRLREYLTGKKDDESRYLINLSHMTIRAGWPRSTQSLASTHEKYIVLEEVDKDGYTIGSKEAGPLDLARKRATTHKGREKIIINSSPSIESGNIWQALLSAQVIFEYVARCPHCLEHQVMRFKQIKWPAKEDIAPDRTQPEYIEMIENDRLAWYECEHCRKPWDYYTRDRAVARGHWRAKQDDGNGLELTVYLKRKRPKKIAFHGPAWISKFVFLSETAAAFLRGQKESGLWNWKEKLRDWANGHCAEPWLKHEQLRASDKILALRDDRPRGVVPGGGRVAELLAQVDTQDDGFWYEIRAWGWGLDPFSWQVREGFVRTTKALVEVLFVRDGKGVYYEDPDGNKYHVHMAVIDAMGHRTKEGYKLCRRFPRRLIPLQGVDKLQSPYTWSTIDFYPPDEKGRKEPIPGGLQLLRVNVTYYKDALASLLEVNKDDPGCWYMHEKTTEAWAQQMCVEFVNDKNLWECPDGKANHAWDVSVYGLAVYDLSGVQFKPRPTEKPPKPKPAPVPVQENDSQFSDFERPVWLDR